MHQLIKISLGPKGQTFIRVAFYTYTVLLFVITLFPINMFRGSGESWLNFLAFPHSDKLIHFMLFLVMTVLLAMSYHFNQRFRYFAIPVMIGITIELLQHFVNTGRTFDIWDIVANASGAATAIILFIRR